MRITPVLLPCLSFFFVGLVGCSNLDIRPTEETDSGSYNPYGGLLSGQDSTGASLLGGDQNVPGSFNNTGPNAYLWRATLSTIGFMGIRTAEPSQGTIITDWYRADNSTNEVQVIVSINGSTLRTENLEVVQARKNASSSLPNDKVFEDKIKDAILLKARELRTQ